MMGMKDATRCVVILIVTSISEVRISAAAAKIGGDARRAHDSDRYNLLASHNEYGPVWKYNMSMKPAVYMEPQHSTLKLRCDADGKPRPNIRWFKDGEPLLSRPFGKMEQRRHWLKLSDLMPFDEGRYTCVVSNRHGKLNHTYLLDVVARSLTPPVITRGPQNQTAIVGDNVTLDCRFYSDIEAYIYWFKLRDDVITAHSFGQSQLVTNWNAFVTIQTEMDYGVSDPTKLILYNVTMADAGIYSCHVTNKYGDVNSSATLTVMLPTATSVIKQKLYITGSRYLYAIIAVALSFPLIIALIIIILILLHRRRWLNWRKRSLAMYKSKVTLSPVPVVHSTQSAWSRQLQQSLLLPADERWELNPAMIEEHELLGEGAFGQVFKATVHGLPNAVKQTVAVKKLKETATDAEIKAFVNEVNVMKSVGRHVNVIGFIGCCTKLGQGGDGILRVAVEFARYGNLRDFLRLNKPDCVNINIGSSSSNNNSALSQCQQCINDSSAATPNIPLTSRHLLSFAYQAARGMQFLASTKIIHRDLAARNVLVGEKLVVKIADFGLTRMVDASADCYRQNHDPLSRVPMKWMAPESLAYNTYTTHSDVWSYGVLLWEIFTYGETPYPSVPVESLSRLLQSGYRMKKPRVASKQTYDVMLRCWSLKPAERPAFTQLTHILDSQLTGASSTADNAGVHFPTSVAPNSPDANPLNHKVKGLGHPTSPCLPTASSRCLRIETAPVGQLTLKFAVQLTSIACHFELACRPEWDILSNYVRIPKYLQLHDTLTLNSVELSRDSPTNSLYSGETTCDTESSIVSDERHSGHYDVPRSIMTSAERFHQQHQQQMTISTSYHRHLHQLQLQQHTLFNSQHAYNDRSQLLLTTISE